MKKVLISILAALAFAAFPAAALAQSTVIQGGTGTTTVPKDYVLIGKDALHLTAVSTSSLGITSPVTSVFGRIGAVVAQTGDYTTAMVSEVTNLYFTNARAIAATLTGYVSGAGTISATDSVLSAIQKLNGNIAALVTGVSSVSNSDSTITVSPTTGAVVASLNLGHANTWSALQTFGNASTTILSASTICFTGDTCRTTWPSTGSGYPFPLTGNATSTLTQFNGGLTAYATSTIGGGAQASGLTVSGGATTTGNMYLGGWLGINAKTPFAPIYVDQGALTNQPVAIFTNLGAGDTGIHIGSLSIGGNTGASIAYDIANERLAYQVRGNGGGGAGTAAHLFSTDATASGSFDSVLRVLGGGVGADLLSLMDASLSEKFKVTYTGTTTIATLHAGLVRSSAGGVLGNAVAGTDYVTGSGTSGNCVQWGSLNSLTDTGSPCGTGSGGVTSLAATYPLAASASTGSVTISSATSSASSAGVLSAADWTSFNNKLSADPYWVYANSAVSTSSPVLITASTTIGNGTQAGGLTINGGATTTGNHYVAGRLGVGTNTPGAQIDVLSSTFPLNVGSTFIESANPSLGVYYTASGSLFQFAADTNKAFISGFAGKAIAIAANGFANRNSGITINADNSFTVGSLGSGIVKSTSGTLSNATNGTDFTLVASSTCAAGSGLQGIKPDGSSYCFTPAGSIYTATYPIVVTGSVISTALSSSTLTASSPLTGSFAQVGTGGSLGIQVANTSQSGYLTSTDWNTFNGKGAGTVTSVGAVYPLSSTGGATPVISSATSSASSAGVLSAADWTTFNGKLSSVTVDSPLTGVGTSGSHLGIQAASGSQNGYLSSGDYSLIHTATTTFSSPLIYTLGTNAVTCQAASGSQAGCLASADWTTFNSKQAALTFTYPLVNTTNTVTLGFGTTTNNTWAAIQTFTNGITLTGTSSPGAVQGQLTYDTGNESLTFMNNDSAISLQIGQEEWTRVWNGTGSTITNGSAVYTSGSHGTIPSVSLSDASVSDKIVTMGLATEDILNGATGTVTTLGVVHGLNTSGFAAGANVYVSAVTPGTLTTVAPVSPNYRYRVGVVTVSSATVGAIQVTPTTAAVGNGTAGQFLGINGSVKQAFLGFSYPLLSTGTGVSVAYGTTTANSWSQIQTFSNASTSLQSISTSLWLNALGTPAGAFLAVDPNGLVIATTTPSGGGGGSGYPFPLTGNATSTLTQFNGGLTAYASSTIGDGTQIGGITISGSATTTSLMISSPANTSYYPLDMSVPRVNSGFYARIGNTTNNLAIFSPAGGQTQYQFGTISNAPNIGVGVTPAASVPMFLFGITSNVENLRIQSANTTNGPIDSVFQNKTTTSTATPNTGGAFITTVATDAVMSLSCIVTARRTGGTAGTAGDGASYELFGSFKKISGTLTQIGATTVVGTAESQIAWDATYAISSNAAVVQVTGAANNNITWTTTCHRDEVTT